MRVLGVGGRDLGWGVAEVGYSGESLLGFEEVVDNVG